MRPRAHLNLAAVPPLSCRPLNLPRGRFRLVSFEIGGVVHCGIELGSEVVDLTAANLAPDMLTLVKMGDAGLVAANEVVKSGNFRVSKPVKLKAPI
eukprot:SAG22_NODE_15240_length_353_cov_1.818898_1_plen_95_part_01